MSKFSTKFKQKQSIVPQQIIKSRLLELSIDELEKDLETEIQINPVLEERNIEESKSGTHTDPFPDQSSYELFIANIPASIDISDELTSQIDTSDLDDKSKAVAKEIIYNLDKNGFLDIELELIADNHGLDINDIDKIRRKVMQLVPSGVGSKDLQEYLIYQIGDSSTLANEIVQDYFDEFLNQETNTIKEKIKCSNEELENALLLISEQNFSPILDNDLGNENVIPDAIVKQKDNQWLILIMSLIHI